MNRPIFLLQIVDADGHVVARLPGGGNLETELIDLITTHVTAKGFMGLHTKTHIKDGVHAALMGLKEQTKFLV